MKKIPVTLASALIVAIFGAAVPASAQQKMSDDQLKAYCRTKADEAYKTDKMKRREARALCIQTGGKSL